MQNKLKLQTLSLAKLEMSLDEIAKTAPHIRRMYTGMYKPVKEILADDMKSFMTKLDEDPEKLRRFLET